MLDKWTTLETLKLATSCPYRTLFVCVCTVVSDFVKLEASVGIVVVAAVVKLNTLESRQWKPLQISSTTSYVFWQLQILYVIFHHSIG